MTVKRFFLTFVLVLVLCFTGGFRVFAAEDRSVSDSARVFDQAGLFTEDQVQQLETSASEIFSGQQIDVIILTTLQIPGTRKQYLEDYYDSRDTELSDSLLLLLNMDPEDRGIEIQGYGSCEYTFPYERLETMLDAIFPYLKAGDYYGGMEEFIALTKQFIEEGSAAAANPSSLQTPEEYSGPESVPASASVSGKPVPHVRNLIIAVVIAVFTVGVMLYSSSGRMTAHQGTYLDSSNSRLLGSYDRYVRTTTSRRHKPKPQETSGHSSGGYSSRGHSHSGSGRSF